MKLIFTVLFCFVMNNVYASCSFSIAQNLNFGVYNPVMSGDNLSSSNVSITCSPTTTYTITLSTGNSNSFTDRQMFGGYKGTDILHYNLYLDSGRTSIFGDGTSGTSYISTSNSNNNIFAKIPQLQNVSAGSYSDNIILDLTF